MNYSNLKPVQLNVQIFMISNFLNKHRLMFLFFSVLNFCLYAQNNEVANRFGEGSQNGYYSNEEVNAIMDELANNYPNICMPKYSIGNTVEGRPIYAFKISDNPNTDEPEPAVYYDACHHGNESIAMAVTINYMMWLCEQYGSNEEATYLVDNREMYFVPLVNVDGYIKGKRTNGRPSTNGCESEFLAGVDLNRNYPVSFGNEPGSSSNECSITYRGTAPFSEPESRAVRDFVLGINPGCAFSFHTPGGVVLMPSGNTAEATEFNIYADLAAEMFAENNYYYSTTKNAFGYVSAGTTRDYLNSLGIIAYTPEVRYPGDNLNSIKSVVAENVKPMQILAWLSGAYPVVKNHQFKGDALPGSSFDMIVGVKNKGVGQIGNNITISVSSNNNNITPTSSFIRLNTLPTQGTNVNNANPYSFKVSNNAQIGETAMIEISVAIDGVQTDLHTVPIIVGEKNTLLADDAESNTVNWTSSSIIATPGNDWGRDNSNSYSGEYSFSESVNGLASSNQSTVYSAKFINVNSTNNLKVQFAAKWSFGEGDSVILQANNNNNGWTDKRIYTNSNDWVYEIIDLSEYTTGSLSLRFAHRTDVIYTGDGFYFDDFEIVEYNEPTTITCEQRDRIALTEVYNSLNGNTWPESTQWDFNQPMNTWNGVTLDGNGCVYSLNLPNLGIQGILPTEIGNLSEIRSINLFNNNIGGEIPTSIGNLTNLKKLNLYSNQLTGIIPSTIGNLQKLELITLASNKFEGNIPEWLTNMNALLNITLQNNQMSGCYASNLTGLCNQLNSYSNNNAKISGGNNFDASWEDFCTNQAGSCDPTSTCRQTDSLALIKVYEALDGNTWPESTQWDFNQPMNTWNGVTLDGNGCVYSLNLPNLGIQGILPTEIGNLSEIRSINLFNNNIGGEIPTSIGNLTNLKKLNLYSNQLTGIIPSTIGNLSKLENLSLSDNQLTGTIPSTIGDLLNLKSMTLKNNQLNGCYDSNLFQLCDRLYPYFSSNTQISNGNNFGLSWESFCDDKYCGDKLSSPNNLTIGNYPNPFKGETTISFTLDEASEVRVTVYNVLGEKIEVLLNNKLQAKGKQSITFDGTNLPAGIYYCKIQTGAHDDLRKMILMK